MMLDDNTIRMCHVSHACCCLLMSDEACDCLSLVVGNK
jgi:hypothetical protein